MVYDTFPFYNEFDMLINHLQWYEDIVDCTVICESDYTFSGNSKPMWLAENPTILEKYAKKDVLHVAYQAEDQLDKNPWTREFQHRDAMLHVIREAHTPNEWDIVLVNDVDEFVNHDTFEFLIGGLGEPSTMVMDHYQGSFKCKLAKPWPGTVVVPYNAFRDHSPHAFRDQRNSLPLIQNGGWHLSYFGGVKAIQQKFEAYSHTELNTPEMKDVKRLQKALDEGTPITDEVKADE
jgi:beta-1,4-mannosyl-glycoprotein beta-1,4-N-acetylglucosaminyltransferase